MKKYLKTLATAMLCLAMALLVSCKKDNNNGTGGGDTPIPPTPTTHEFVDLGLPSGVLWATCNVGAKKPEEYGDYFAWGEVTTKSYYDSNTYQWYDSCHNITKYNRNSEYGTVDNMEVLVLEDDAAHVNWGGDWRMPTVDEFHELLAKCEYEFTKHNGVSGLMVTGSNGKGIFLPAAGRRDDGSLYDEGYDGYYWSSSLRLGEPDRAYELYFNSGKVSMSYGSNRYYGQSVRPVSAPQN